jgi:tetratricopeptide (TPR) repeat protein
MNTAPKSRNISLEEMYQYLTGTLDTEFSKVIKDQLESDSDLVSAMAEMDLAIEAGMTLEQITEKREWMREKLSQIHLKRGSSVENRRVLLFRNLYKRRWLSMAAAFLLLAVAAMFLFQQPDKNKWTAYAEPFPNVLTVRSDNQDTQMNNAMQLYEGGQYQKSANALELILKSNPDLDEAQFYLGISQLFNGQAGLASETFQSLNTRKHPFQDESRWYLSIALLNAGEKEKAKEYLENLSRRSGKIGRNAKKILDQLK